MGVISEADKKILLERLAKAREAKVAKKKAQSANSTSTAKPSGTRQLLVNGSRLEKETRAKAAMPRQEQNAAVRSLCMQESGDCNLGCSM